jgi:hypothetical protein
VYDEGEIENGVFDKNAVCEVRPLFVGSDDETVANALVRAEVAEEISLQPVWLALGFRDINGKLLF